MTNKHPLPEFVTEVIGVPKRQPLAVSSGDTAPALELPRGTDDKGSSAACLFQLEVRVGLFTLPRAGHNRDFILSTARHVRSMQHGCILLHPDAQITCAAAHLRERLRNNLLRLRSNAASQTSPFNSSGKPAVAGGLGRACGGPDQPAFGCGGMETYRAIVWMLVAWLM